MRGPVQNSSRLSSGHKITYINTASSDPRRHDYGRSSSGSMSLSNSEITQTRPTAKFPRASTTTASGEMRVGECSLTQMPPPGMEVRGPG